MSSFGEAATMPARTARQQLAQALDAFTQSSVELERQRQRARRIDGRIIGTGQADYTKANTHYRLRIAGKPFQLIDAPGIEGDVKRYSHLVEEAVAKAHLVFFVNGTNKKPEAKTAREIGRYLRRNTQVLPIVNVRGLADAYEFEEDRGAIADNKEAANALLQTESVLQAALGEGVVLPGHCVQGNLAFSALAIDVDSGLTSIHPDRQDLARAQRGYLEAFGSAADMLRFSEVSALVDVLTARTRTFESDIVESNKGQVLALVGQTKGTLARMREQHAKFMASVAPHFNACLKEVERVRDDTLRDTRAELQGASNTFFVDITAASDEVIERNFGNVAAIDTSLREAIAAHQETLGRRWKERCDGASSRMEEDVANATRRLTEDVDRMNLQLRLETPLPRNSLGLDAGHLEMDLSLTDWGGMVAEVGSYAFLGFEIGTTFPGYGNLIGAAVGVVAGLVKVIASWLTGKRDRIRKAQKQMHAQIEALQIKQKIEVDALHAQLSQHITTALDQAARQPILQSKAALARPGALLDEQIKALSDISNQIREMPRGSIHEIRC